MSLHQDEVGNKIAATIVSQAGSRHLAFDLTDFTVTFLFRKPSGTVVEVEARVTDAKKGAVEYNFVEGDLDEAGSWEWQSKLESETVTLYSQLESFTVAEHLVATE